MKNKKPNIFVNATAAEEAGALSILSQFLSTARSFAHLYNLTVFTSAAFPASQYLGIRFVHIPKNGNIGRIKWDFLEFAKWCRSNEMNPDLIISFQNMGVRFNPDIPQLIYYHQSAPFSRAKWRIFRKEERIFWFYKHVYPWFTRALLTRKTYFVVQTGWMKAGIIRKFPVRHDQVKVLLPDIHIQPAAESEMAVRAANKKHFTVFYPAMPFVNKNHIEIVNAVHHLINIDKFPCDRIRVIFTCEAEPSKTFVQQIHRLGLNAVFHFSGKVPQDKMREYYQAADLLVFPSVLETLGLPLMEGAAFGLKIIASDLEYAREVLNGYEGAEFAPTGSPALWADAIKRSFNERKRFSPFRKKAGPGWVDFFTFADTIIKEK